MAPGRSARSASGPSGHASAPPSWLKTISLPTTTLPKGSSLWRCHRSTDGPLFFGPGARNPPIHRFDAPAGEYQVLYVAMDYDGALVETLLRNPLRRIVDERDLAIRNMAILKNDAPLKLVNAYGAGLSTIGATAAISTGKYTASRRWSLALWEHANRPDGIIYTSRHNTSLLCAAIFESPHSIISLDHTTPLLSDRKRVSDLLAAHGKAIA
jgi:RES domain